MMMNVCSNTNEEVENSDVLLSNVTIEKPGNSFNFVIMEEYKKRETNSDIVCYMSCK